MDETRGLQLRPMDLRDILDETIELYRSNFALFLGISALMYVPIYLLGALVAGSRGSAAWTPMAVLLASPLVSAALAWATSERFLGRPISPRTAYQPVLQRFTAFIATQVLVWLAIAAPMTAAVLLFTLSLLGGAGAAAAVALLVILPAAFLSAVVGVWLSLTPQIQVIEDTRYFAAMRRSRELVTGHGLKVFFVLLIIGLFAFLISGLMVSVPNIIAEGVKVARGLERMPSAVASLLVVLEGAVGTIVAPLQLIALTLVYYDLRIRKEGFDLETLARALERTSAPEPLP